MLITIDEARKIMESDAEKYTDEQIQQMLDLWYAYSNLIIDRYLDTKKEGGEE